jgi:hypothetical protein
VALTGRRIKITANAEIRNDALSKSTTPPMPIVLNSMPPSAGPIRRVPCSPSASSALAVSSCSFSTRCGMSALLAGP